MKMHVIYGLPCVLDIADVIKKNVIIHLIRVQVITFQKNSLALGKKKNKLKLRQKNCC